MCIPRVRRSIYPEEIRVDIHYFDLFTEFSIFFSSIRPYLLKNPNLLVVVLEKVLVPCVAAFAPLRLFDVRGAERWASQWTRFLTDMNPTQDSE